MSSRFLTVIYNAIQSIYLQGEKKSLEAHNWTDDIAKF